MSRKTTPVKPPSNSMVRAAARAMATGKATSTATRAMGARIMAEREETIPDKPKGRKS